MVTKLKAHAFQINSKQGTAFCSCYGWALQGFSSEYARRNHKHHLTNLPDVEKETRTNGEQPGSVQSLFACHTGESS